nr:AbrB/MazE/SpoVT family DNA-binding domain-containing protein [Oscillochloris trichoides]
MRTRIQKWGNSLAVRIPKSFASEIGLVDDSEVDLCVVDGQLRVVRISPSPYSLDALLAEVTDDNLHHEVSTEPAVGNEVW